MSGVNVFAVGDSEDSDQWTRIATTAKRLDKIDFLPEGYFVDEAKFPRRPTGSTTRPSSKRKGKSIDSSESDQEAGENADVDDVPMDQSTPSVILSQSIRGSSASSGEPHDSCILPSPTSVHMRKRGRAHVEEDYEAEIANLKKKRDEDHMLFDKQAREMAELRQLMLAMSRNNDSKLEAIISSLGGAMPLASAQPSQVQQPLLLLPAAPAPTTNTLLSLPTNPSLTGVPSVSRTATAGSVDPPPPPPEEEPPLTPAPPPDDNDMRRVSFDGHRSTETLESTPKPREDPIDGIDESHSDALDFEDVPSG